MFVVEYDGSGVSWGSGLGEKWEEFGGKEGLDMSRVV